MPYLNVSPLDGTSGFRVTGELDMASVPQLEQALPERNGSGPLVLDMAGVSFIDSMGLRLLIKLCIGSVLRPALVIRNPSPRVRQVLAISLPDGIPEMAIEFDGRVRERRTS